MRGTEQGVAAVTPQNAWQQSQVFSLQLCSLQFWMYVVLWKSAVLPRIFRDLSQSHQTNGAVVFSDR